MSEVKKEELIKAAKELNDVLGLDPQIKTGKKVTEKELSEQILEAAELILPEDDISDETMRVIKLLKDESVEEEDEEEVDTESEPEEDDDEVEEEEVEDEEDDDEVEEEEVEDEEDDDEVEEEEVEDEEDDDEVEEEEVEDEEDDDEVEEEEVEDEEDDDDEDDDEEDVEETEEQDELELEEEKPAEKSKVKAKPTPPSTGVGVTRIGAAALVIKRAKNPMTVEDWVKRTDELYVKEGGKPNLKESRYAVNVAVKVLEAYGLIEVTGDKVSKLE